MKNQKLRARRLGWAGVELEFDGQTLLIDYIQDTEPLVQLRSTDEPFPPSLQPGAAIGALLTHLHADHADAKALAIALKPNAKILRPEPATGTPADMALTDYAEQKFAQSDLNIEVVEAWSTRHFGPFKVHAAPAIDGFGDPQLSWVVECDGKRVFHTGDTLFHGYWWRIVNKFGDVDLAFLPINAPIVDFPLLQPASDLEAVMGPEEAAMAASILKAKLVVPIHYGSLHKPPMYIETADATQRLLDKLTAYQITAKLYQPGEWFEVG